jgi:hypothetical protein
VCRTSPQCRSRITTISIDSADPLPGSPVQGLAERYLDRVEVAIKPDWLRESERTQTDALRSVPQRRGRLAALKRDSAAAVKIVAAGSMLRGTK